MSNLVTSSLLWPMYVVGRAAVLAPVSVSHDPFVVEDLSAPFVPLLDVACGVGEAGSVAGAADPLATLIPSPSPGILGPRLRLARCSEIGEEVSWAAWPEL